MEGSYNLNGQQFSSSDLAHMRAGRLLIDDPPAPGRKTRGSSGDFLESLICDSSGNGTGARECIVRKAMKQYGTNPEVALRIARLEAVFALKAASIVGTILELVLGPLDGSGVQIHFRGIRPERNQYEQPEMIQVRGVCKLGDV